MVAPGFATCEEAQHFIDHFAENEARCRENRERIKRELAIRKEAGLLIDPETAELCSEYTMIADPYGLDPELQDEAKCIGIMWFAQLPGGVWVAFDDLPQATVDALRTRPARDNDGGLGFRNPPANAAVFHCKQRAAERS